MKDSPALVIDGKAGGSLPAFNTKPRYKLHTCENLNESELFSAFPCRFGTAPALHDGMEAIMKSLRLFALILALGFSNAYAQQEVDPDHFDQPAHVATQKAQHHHQQKRVNLASKHAGKSHHHHAHTAA